MMRPYRRGLRVWLALMVAESLHGTVRELWLKPVVGDLRARQIAVGTGALMIFAITLVCIRWISLSRRSDLLRLGILWLILTVAFEITLGVATGASAARILSDYDLAHGGLMPLGLLFLTLSPLLAHRFRPVASG